LSLNTLVRTTTVSRIRKINVVRLLMHWITGVGAMWVNHRSEMATRAHTPAKNLIFGRRDMVTAPATMRSEKKRLVRSLTGAESINGPRKSARKRRTRNAVRPPSPIK
jgi:hypothetical protein